MAQKIEEAVKKFDFGINFTAKDKKDVGSGKLPDRCRQKLGEALVLTEKQEKAAQTLFDKANRSTERSAANQGIMKNLKEALHKLGKDRYIKLFVPYPKN